MKRLVPLFLLLLPVAATAQQQAPKPGCEDKPSYRQFDFWVGEWSVSVTGSPEKVAGSSVIQLINQSCAILENWTGTGGGGGKSVNFFHPATKQWHQTWLDSFGGVTFFKGEYRDSAMYFTGEQVGPRGRTSAVRLTFFKLSTRQVRQLGEQQDSTKAWKTTYDLTYTRK